METPRAKRRLGFWHGVLAVFLVFVIVGTVGGILGPVFSRGRRAAAHSPLYDRSDERVMSKSVGGESSDYTAQQSASTTESGSWTTALAASAPRMLISTADINLEVPSVRTAHDQVLRIATRAKGFVTQSNVSGESGVNSGDITVRVPAANYQSAVAEISKLGKVTSKNESGQDVTSEYVDLQSRLRNLKRGEQALLGVLGQAHSVQDILAVERELNRVRGEIEQATGRSKYLESQVAMATINVSLREPVPAVQEAIQWNVIQTAIKSGHALGGVFRVLASMVIWFVIWTPLWALLGGVFYSIKTLRARRNG